MRDFCVHSVEIGVSSSDRLETPFSVCPRGNTTEKSDVLASASSLLLEYFMLRATFHEGE